MQEWEAQHARADLGALIAGQFDCAPDCVARFLKKTAGQRVADRPPGNQMLLSRLAGIRRSIGLLSDAAAKGPIHPSPAEAGSPAPEYQ